MKIINFTKLFLISLTILIIFSSISSSRFHKNHSSKSYFNKWTEIKKKIREKILKKYGRANPQLDDLLNPYRGLDQTTNFCKHSCIQDEEADCKKLYRLLSSDSQCRLCKNVEKQPNKKEFYFKQMPCEILCSAVGKSAAGCIHSTIYDSKQSGTNDGKKVQNICEQMCRPSSSSDLADCSFKHGEDLEKCIKCQPKKAVSEEELYKFKGTSTKKLLKSIFGEEKIFPGEMTSEEICEQCFSRVGSEDCFPAKVVVSTIQPKLDNIKIPTNNIKPSTDDIKPPTDNIKPLTNNIKPPAENIKPPTDNIKLPTDNVKPPTDNIKPLTNNIKPPAENIKPPAENIKLPAENIKLPTDNVKPPTDKIKPLTNNIKPPAENIKPPTDTVKPPTDNIKPLTNNIKPPADNIKLPTDNVKPPTDNVKPLTNNIKPPTDNIKPPKDNIKLPTDNVKPPPDNIKPLTNNIKPPTDNIKPPKDNIKLPTDNVKPPPDNIKPPTDNIKPPKDNIKLPTENIKSKDDNTKPMIESNSNILPNILSGCANKCKRNDSSADYKCLLDTKATSCKKCINIETALPSDCVKCYSISGQDNQQCGEYKLGWSQTGGNCSNACEKPKDDKGKLAGITGLCNQPSNGLEFPYYDDSKKILKHKIPCVICQSKGKSPNDEELCKQCAAREDQPCLPLGLGAFKANE